MSTTLDDLDSDQMANSSVRGVGVSNFHLLKMYVFLEHLVLLSNGRPTNAAVLLFGIAPQKFLITTEMKCAHFHGTEVKKPIPPIKSTREPY